MAVYALAQLRIHDAERYGRYMNNFVARFTEVFGKFGGKLLAADDAPRGEVAGMTRLTRAGLFVVVAGLRESSGLFLPLLTGLFIAVVSMPALTQDDDGVAEAKITEALAATYREVVEEVW